MLFSPQILVRNPPKIITGGGSLGLQTNLTGFWSFENTSWTDDTASATTLTATGSPTSVSTAPALVGNYLTVAGSDYLSAASNTNVSAGGGSFSVQIWVYTSTSTTEAGAVGKGASGFGNQEWGIGMRFTSANVWSFNVTDSSSTPTRAEDTVAFTSNAWTHLVGTYDSGTKGLTLYKNGSSVGTATATNPMQSTSNNFIVAKGGYGGTGAASGFRFDQCGFWKGRILSAGDVTLLYNSGSGLSYAAMA